MKTNLMLVYALVIILLGSYNKETKAQGVNFVTQGIISEMVANDKKQVVEVGNSWENEEKGKTNNSTVFNRNLNFNATIRGLGVSAAPNPFTTYTDIEFELPRTCIIDVNLYDMYGRLVRMVAHRAYRSAGKHTVRLEGRGLPPGVYICQVQTPYGTESVKVLYRGR